MTGDGFWAAYKQTRESIRCNTLDGVIRAAQEMRRANRYEPDHVIRAEIPAWAFGTFTDDDRLELANVHNIHAVQAGLDD